MTEREFDQSNMFEPLLSSDPSFSERWERLRNEDEDASEPAVYTILSELARHLIENLESGETHRFHAVFDVVERWHITGDHSVKEAATIGLLEDLQNGNLHRQTRPDDFLPWLQPETLRCWVKMQEFWLADKPIG